MRESRFFKGRGREVAGAILIFLLTAVVFYPALRCQFVDIDDPSYITKNDYVKAGLTRDSLRWAFSTFYAAFWHPLAWISHMLDVQLFGLKPFGHHLTNVFLHAANSALLWLALCRLTRTALPAAFCVLLFAVHPLRVEVVAWVAERKELLSAFFGLLCLIAYERYVRAGGRSRYVMVVAFFLCALMSKPTLVVLPACLLLLDYWPLQRFRERRPVSLIVEKLPLLALSAVAGGLRLLAEGRTGVRFEELSFLFRGKVAVVCFVQYIGLFFWPANLAVFYPYPGINSAQVLTDQSVLLAAVIIAVMSAAAVRWRREAPYFFVGWFWNAVVLFPVSGIIQFGMHAMADRYTYMSQIGLGIAAGWGALGGRASKRLGLRIVCVCALFAMAFLTRRQLVFWRDTRSLYERDLAVTPDDFRIHNSLGTVLARQGEAVLARGHFEQALAVRPDYADALNNIGCLLMNQGERPSALRYLTRAALLQPNDETIRGNLDRASGLLGAASGHPWVLLSAP